MPTTELKMTLSSVKRRHESETPRETSEIFGLHRKIVGLLRSLRAKWDNLRDTSDNLRDTSDNTGLGLLPQLSSSKHQIKELLSTNADPSLSAAAICQISYSRRMPFAQL